MSEVVTETPVVTPATEPENSTIRQLRDALDKANQRAKEAETAKTALEREKLTETERLRAELGDKDRRLGEVSGFQSKYESGESKFKALRLAVLSELPEEIRAKVEKLLEAGQTEGDKFEMLSSIKDMLGVVTPAATPAPIVAGSPTNPGKPPALAKEPVAPAAPLTPAELASMSLSDALRLAPKRG